MPSRRALVTCSGAAPWHARLRRLAALLLAVLAPLGLTGCPEENEPPELGPISTQVFSEGGPAFTTADLNANAWVNRPVGTPEPSFTWSWTVDGVDAGVATPTVPAAMTSKYEVWEVSGSAWFDTTPVGPDSASITIINSPPTVTLDRIPNVNPCPSEPVRVVTHPFDADGDAVVLTYAWTVNAIAVPAATGDTLDCQYFTVGDRVIVSVRADDGEEVGPLVRSNRLTVPPPAAPAMAAEGPSSSTPAPSADHQVDRLVAHQTTVNAAQIVALHGDRLEITDWNICHIRSNDSIDCSGLEDHALTQPPEGRFSQLALELDYGCAIRVDDSSVVCWGEPLDDLGQLSPPDGPFSQVDVGSTSACGLSPTGEITCWGGGDAPLASPPEGEFVWIEMSGANGCAIARSGDVICWGIDE